MKRSVSETVLDQRCPQYEMRNLCLGQLERFESFLNSVDAEVETLNVNEY
jgi:hypothetical protein